MEGPMYFGFGIRFSSENFKDNVVVSELQHCLSGESNLMLSSVGNGYKEFCLIYAIAYNPKRIDEMGYFNLPVNSLVPPSWEQFLSDFEVFRDLFKENFKLKEEDYMFHFIEHPFSI